MKAKILVTGATGFLGKYIIQELASQDLQILGRTAIRGYPFIWANLNKIVEISSQKYDWVIHVAGLAHDVTNKNKGEMFYQTNYYGTKRLLKALVDSNNLPERFTFISSVAVYGQLKGEGIDESDQLKSAHPYGHSKILAEQAVMAWGDQYDVKISIVRLPLVVGKGPPGNLGRMINAIAKGHWININNGEARRSMVWAEDVARILPLLSEQPDIYNLCDGINPSYFDLSQKIRDSYSTRSILSMPYFAIKPFALVGDLMGKGSPFNSRTLETLSNTLTFSDEKARVRLDWKPSPVLEIISSCLT